MGQAAAATTGPDFGAGIALAELPTSGTLAGRVEGTPVLLSRPGGEWHAVSGTCSHYGAPLAEGLVEGDTVRCPWHHACFSLRTGEALEAPAFAALARWRVEVVGDRLFVRAATDEARAQPVHAPRPGTPKRIVLVGGGAAAFACAERLRRRGFDGTLTLLSADNAAPCDRPKLSKDFLAGTALATAAGLRVDDGILVDSRLRASAPGVFAAGDVARYETAAGRTRIEHWVHAQRQGQAAADNMLGDARAFADPPFFWTHHYGTELRHVGDGHSWNEAKIEGSPEAGDCLVRYFRNGALVAAAAIGRDRELLVTRNLL